MTLEGLYRHALASLTAALGPSEGKAAARLIVEDCAGFAYTKVFTSPELPLEPETVSRVNYALERIAAGMPPQYAIGRARFMGMDLRVTPATLIPRPETAGLVDLITDDMGARRDLRVLDAGTGSGCIAIALARALPYSRVTAIDISPDTLAVARENAGTLHTQVHFGLADILRLPTPTAPLYDIIVSNPPYITESEHDEVDTSVDAYEPHAALYVPDCDPLRFYNALMAYGRTAVEPGGRLYFEINPHYADAMADALIREGYKAVEILPDAYGRRRYARATR